MKRTIELILSVLFLLIFCRCSFPATTGRIENEDRKSTATPYEKLLNERTRYVYFNEKFTGKGYTCTSEYEGYGDVKFSCRYAFDPTWVDIVYGNIHSSDEVRIRYPEPNAPEFVFSIRGNHREVGPGMLIYYGVLP